MARTFTRQEYDDLVKIIEPDIQKLKKFKTFEKDINEEIASEILVKSFSRRCLGLIMKDFKDEEPLVCTEDIISLYKTLFSKLYLRTKYFTRKKSVEEIFLNFDDLNDSIQIAEQIKDGFMWLFVPASVKKAAEHGWVVLNKFKDSQTRNVIKKVYEDIFSNEPSVVELVSAFREYHSIWQEWVFQIINESLEKQSVYVSKSQMIVQQAAKIADRPFNNETFDAEVDQYRDYIQNFISKDTYEKVQVDIHRELEKLPLEELNKDRSGIRINTLISHGYQNLKQLYDAPIQEMSSIRGISTEAACKIKYKVQEIEDILLAGKKEEITPLQLNYDSRNLNTTNIVKAVYNLRRLFKVKDEADKIGFIDISEVDQDISALKIFRLDACWLFMSPDEKRSIIKAYQSLTVLFNSEKYKNHTRFISCIFRNLNSLNEETVWEDFRQNTVSYYTCIEKIIPDAFKTADLTYGLPEELAEKIKQETVYSDGLTCDLRNYQIWGVRYILRQKRVLLGDEMGLGKTIQAIAAIVSLRNTGMEFFIVICPASVMVNWFKEIKRFSSLQAYIGHGTPKERTDSVNAWKYHGGVLITTYETYPKLDIDDPNNIGLVTVDEAHYIKNPDANRSKKIRSLCSAVERVLFLTGTPLENKVDEMLSLIEILNKAAAAEASKYANLVASQQFKNAVAPVYFRRKQIDVNKELPEKIEVIDWCKMNRTEYDAYDRAVLNAINPFMPMRKVSWNVDDLNYSSKAKALEEIVKEAVEDNRKTIVFSFFTETIDKILSLFSGHVTEPITGSMPPAKRQQIIDEFTENKDLYVLVSQIQAGGTGLNIQSASVVVMCEPQVKPSIEDQAIARAHRMGQSRNVIVHRLCCENSIDERMLEILNTKKKEFKVFADRSVAGEQSLDLDENEDALKNAIREEVEAIRSRHANKQSEEFRESEEGKAWQESQDRQKIMVFQKMQNSGRQRTVSDAQRQRILRRDHFTCQLCGAKGPGAGGEASLEVDHKVPFSLGGTDDDSNLWTLCKSCNRGKSNKYID